MLIARELRKTNIAEYILYMWQIEDSLRTCSFNESLIEEHLVKRFRADEVLSREISAWYKNLAVMMEKEHVQDRGHLQVLVNLLNDLDEFHLKMLDVRKDQEYVNLYMGNRQIISELIQKSGSASEIEACFQALYGLMMLKIKNSEIFDETEATVQRIAHQVGHLSARYIQFENDDFEF
jgi:hypothetical protein